MYKLAQGSCPRSYGTNVARLAGIPDKIVERAAQHAADLESKAEMHQKRAAFHSTLKELGNLATSVGTLEALQGLQSRVQALLQ